MVEPIYYFIIILINVLGFSARELIHFIALYFIFI